ncbi:MAG: DUF1254 domain-containing protein [Coriobacteriales bacterium]|nr:DUF1254 domain-containing protein [Coriobacteriales bacterium]
MLSSRAVAVLAGVSLAAVLFGCTTGKPPESDDYRKAYKTGLEAYTYGLPLVVTNATFLSMTSVNVSNGAFGPVNRFNNVRSLNNPGSKAVVAPGSTGLSSIAWLDLSKEPQVLHLPKVEGHNYALALVDPYTENIENLGSTFDTKPGYYVIAGPGQREVAIPKGTRRIDVDYDRIWVIGSTQLKGASDVAAVNRIQDGYTLTPLSSFGTNYLPPTPAHPRTTVKSYAVPTGLQFFDVLGQQLKQFPPPAADEAALRKFAEVGIGPGMTPSKDSGLSSETLRGLTDAAAAGPAQIKKDTQALFLADFPKHDGYLLGGFGRYGTDYELRAVIAQIGLGAVTPDSTIYAMSWTDHDRKPLNGSTNYVLHMPSAPPVNGDWSLTVYDMKGALIPNAINRYAFSKGSKLARNPDGSVDFYLQADKPSDPAQVSNWLPTARGQGFEVTWRLIAPEPEKVDGVLDGTGWQPPAINPAK